MPDGSVFQFEFPLHVIKQGHGFAAIVGDAPGLGPQRIPVVFTKSNLAAQFIAQTTGRGEIQPLSDQDQFSGFLRSLPQGMKYVAFDPHDGYSRNNVLISRLL
jgi:hypothetical protein